MGANLDIVDNKGEKKRVINQWYQMTNCIGI